jgi:hypothetical protein
MALDHGVGNDDWILTLSYKGADKPATFGPVSCVVIMSMIFPGYSVVNNFCSVLHGSALVLERRKPFLGKRIDIASDEITGEQAAKILSNELGYMIRYVQIPFERIRESNEDMARMYEWYEKVGTGIDIPNLHQKYPEVNWRTFNDWVKSQNWNEII